MHLDHDPCGDHACDHCAICTGADGSEPRCCATGPFIADDLQRSMSVLATEESAARHLLAAIHADLRRKRAPGRRGAGADLADPALAPPPRVLALPPGSQQSLTLQTRREETHDVRERPTP